MQGSFLLTTRKKSKTPQQNVSGSDGHIRVITYTIAIILKSLRKQNISALAICFKKFSFKRKEKLKVRCQSLTVLCQKRRVCYNHCYDCVFFFSRNQLQIFLELFLRSKSGCLSSRWKFKNEAMKI